MKTLLSPLHYLPDTFMTQEKMALTVFDMPENTPNDTLQKKLQQGIVYWNKNIALLERFFYPLVLKDLYLNASMA